MIRDILKESDDVRNAIEARLKELKWNYVDLSKECAKLGRPEIRRQSISRYMNKVLRAQSGILNSDQIIFITKVLCIPVNIVVGNSKRPVKYSLPKYSLKKALEDVKEYEKSNPEKQDDAQGISSGPGSETTD